MAAALSVDPARWQAVFEDLLARIAPWFRRVESRRRARAMLLGLLSDVPEKNCWTLAEHAGEASPHGMQDLLARASWDADGVRDEVRAFVLEHLADPDAIVVIDETGDLKKGTHTVGVQRQYTGTAGRIENAQVSVYLNYASPRGHALIDRALYLPKSWTGDEDRCAAAGVPEDKRALATKPELAADMTDGFFDAGGRASWVAGDEVYGRSPTLRRRLEKRGQAYVLAVNCDHPVTPTIGAPGLRCRADELAKRLPKSAWQPISAGAGSKGERWYEWAWIPIEADTEHPGCRWLLIRRHIRTKELAFYHCYAPHHVPLGELVRVAGRRWTIEESFQASKGEIGLDQHQVRRWRSWYRWTTLALTAHALLAVLTAQSRTEQSTVDDLIPLTLNEIRHLIDRLIIQPARHISHILHWSRWRRRHQARARTSHYQRQATQLNKDHNLRLPC